MSETKAVQYDAIEAVVIGGDLGKLTPEQRVSYYQRVCQSLDLNPLTKPFEYIVLNSKLTLYARRDAADQLRKRDGVSVAITDRRTEDGVYIVTAQARLPDGRTDESTGAVFVDGLKGEARANALMKAETKAKRRVTLSIVGLGWLDETEVETIPDAQVVAVSDNGEMKTHWIDDPKVKAAFWAYVHSKGLSDKDVYRLLRIEHIHDYQGSKDDFKIDLETALQRAAQSKHPELDNATETELQTMLYGKE